jgi:glycine/D-amino acid oxidase-like deaminating enzyme/nitrite reductase/ring-hydroxylating ferredoxin subunit
VVIGGGIVGVTAAVLLMRQGKTVALLEARRIGRQVTGRSTAKVTSLHSLIYADLIERLGEERARLYGEANQAGIERIAAFVAEKGIACGFERQPAYPFTQDRGRVARIEAEVEAARRLGLPASLVRETELPYPIAAAVRFDHQAQFNPTAYLRALGDEISGGGSHVFERTRALEVAAGEPCTVRTDSGTVRARDVVVATNIPIVPEGKFHEKVTPRAHLGVAGRPDPARAPLGMHLGIDPPTHSVRTTPHDGGRLLVAIGESFAPGQVADTEAMYRELATFVRERFGAEAITHRWFNEDYDSHDRIPFVGRAEPGAEHLWVATGFCSWGIAGGTAAAVVLAEGIAGRRHPWAELYDAARQPGEAPNKGSPPMRQEEPPAPRQGPWNQLRPGEAAVFKGDDEEPVAVYRDDGGTLHAVSAVCTHLGCEVSWNNGDRTWNCGCHGSIFAPDGTVLHGPAVADLTTKPAAGS